MMCQFTQEDKDYLYQVFADNDHEVREGVTTKSGKVRWFVYLERDSIVRHLDNRFFGEWSMSYHSHRDLEKYSETYCRITIRDAYRENNGSNTANKANDENMGKGAASDAFKRAASSWGIGLYLQDAPQIWTAWDYVDGNGKVVDYDKQRQRMNEALQQVYNWLKTLRGGQSSQPAQRQAPQIVPPPQGEKLSEEPQLANGQVAYSDSTTLVSVFVGKNKKPFYVIGGANMFERKALRELGYTANWLDADIPSGDYHLSDPVTVVYQQDGKYKNILRIRRDSTGQVVHVQEAKEKAS